MQISVDIMSAITGMMLSDGPIAQRSITGNAQFVFVQSGKPAKREYFYFVLRLLMPFCSANYTPNIKEWYDNKQDKMYNSISLTTMQLPCFTVLRSLWYKETIKIVSLNIKELQTPITLAHWIMGDGSKQNEGLHLSLYAFSQSNVDILTDALKNRYGLHCTIHATERGPRIYKNKNSVNNLRPIILAPIVPSMQYKLSLS